MSSVIKKLILLAVIAGLLFAAGLSIWSLTIKVPDLSAFGDRKIAQSTKIYDRTGEVLLYEMHGDIKRTVVSFDDISRHIKNAVVAIEDDQFYSHFGIDVPGIIKAVLGELGLGGRRGGSTITQQLVKNSLLTPERTIARKIKEMVLAIKLEQKYSKEEILNFYLNEIPFGSNLYGVENASQSFFGKSARDLTLAESAYLASLPQLPTYYSPYGSHRDKLEERKNLVLKRMVDLGFISEDEANNAKEEKVVFQSKENSFSKALHFVMMAREYLAQKYGEDMAQRGGLKVITSLDWELQKKAEDVTLEYAEQNQEKFKAYNAGLVAIDTKTGEVLAMVGSRSYFGYSLPEGCTPGVDCKFEPQVNVTNYGNGRQPGSAIKPFIYATAFKKGYTPETVVFDLKTEFQTTCNPNGTPATPASVNQLNEDGEKNECYMPQNSDGNFRGPVTFREALAQSLNIPSIKALYLAGVGDALKTIKEAGITTLSDDPNQYGLTLVLGGGEVSLLELTGAYSVFANGGYSNPNTIILKVENSEGKILEEYSPNPRKALAEEVAFAVTDILSDNEARAPMFGANSPLYFKDYNVAAKTGTTNDFRDAWTVGYSPNVALGVWVGNNDNSQMEYKTASFIASPFWRAAMQVFLESMPKEEFAEPKGYKTGEDHSLKPFLRRNWKGGLTYKIDKISGKLATEYTPDELVEEIPLTQIHSILHWVDKNNPRGAVPQNPEQDPQYNLWEYPVRKWAEEQRIKEETEADIPKEFDDIHKPEYAPKITITSPIKEAVYDPQKLLNVRIEHSGKFNLSQIDVFLDGSYLGSTKSAPFSFSFIPSDTLAGDTEAELKIIGYDEVMNKGEALVKIRFN